MRIRNLVLAFILGAAAAAGIALSLNMLGDDPVPSHATVLPAGNELPDFSLLDHSGNAVGKSVFAGQWDVVFFGFTHCPDICPLTLGLLRQARDRLVSAHADEVPRIVLVSVDPERDTPDALAEYIAYFGEGNLGITGDLEEISKLTDALGIFFAKAALEDGDYTVDHSTVVLVIDPEGRFRALFSAPHSIDGLVHDLPLIMAMQ
jgi:protein SCO1/2